MKKSVPYNEYAAKAIEIMSKGALLTTAYGGKTNTMTIGWGSIGFLWGRPVFMAMVRSSRFTYNLIEKSGEFTVSIPFADMQKALGVCGSQSGRDCNKLAAAGLKPAAAEKTATPVIDAPGLHFECKVVYKQAMAPEQLDSELQAKWYGNNDYHTMYYGEIVASYVTE